MQSTSTTARAQHSLGFPPPQRTEPLPCPRCDSTATKFCYYNNYNLSQPRYLCKSCRRYWTHGGTLRNVPLGGATRKISKKPRPTTTTATTTSTNTSPNTPPPNPVVAEGEMATTQEKTPLLSLNSKSEACLELSGYSYEFTRGFDGMGFPELSESPAGGLLEPPSGSGSGSEYNAWQLSVSGAESDVLGWPSSSDTF